MARGPLIVLADDLTGAAEVAALAHEAGLLAVVLTQLPRNPVPADVLVLDTGTRLATPARAIRRVRACTEWMRNQSPAAVFKKTDSVLRGPVLAELLACAAALKLQRSLLVAGNPSLGRIIRGGQLTLEGIPINQTAFAQDPHHPALSAAVLDLLHARDQPSVVSLAPSDPLPARGVVVGDHTSATDTAAWAARVDTQTLAAGGADFFRAWLPGRCQPGAAPARDFMPSCPALMLHGTTASTAGARTLMFNGLRAPPPVRVAAALRQRQAVAVAATPLTLADPLAPTHIAQGFAGMTRSLRDAGAFRHLLVAGGATAASVLRALGWQRLTVTHVWGPGVVSLQPASLDFIVTLKPGSYPWPAGIRESLPALFS